MLKNGDKFFLNGGDGNQSFFAEPKTIKFSSLDWTPRITGFSDAYIFEILNGNLSGQFIALTSRWVMTLPEQIKSNNGASVIVHGWPAEPGSRGIGMSYIEKL